MTNLSCNTELKLRILEAQSEASLDGILVVSPAREIISYNRRFLELWEVPPDIVLSRSDEDAIRSVLSKVSHPQEFLERILYLNSHPKENGIDRIDLVDGRVFERYSTMIQDQSGQIYGRIWFFSDITAKILDQKKISEQQELIVQSSKMSALGELASGVAHEINTPLAVISLKLEQMQALLESRSYQASDFLEAVDILKRTTERIAKIVSGLLFFARDRRSLPKEETRIIDLISETLSLCQERFLSHGVSLDIQWRADRDRVSVECSPVEISQVFLNLLNNSFDAIMLEEQKWIALAISDLGNEVEVAITDSGHGIPLEVQNKMMEPFFTTKGIGKGTGLGLSISKGIVETHHGRFIYDSNSPHTRFVIVLPKKQITI